MSFLDTLKNYEHTFTAWVTKQYAKLYAADPKIEKVADVVFQYAIPAVQILVDAEAGGAAGAAVGIVAEKVQAGLHAAGALIYDFGPNPSASQMILAAQTDLASIKALTGIKNPNTSANVDKIVNTLAALAAAFTTPAAV